MKESRLLPCRTNLLTHRNKPEYERNHSFCRSDKRNYLLSWNCKINKWPSCKTLRHMIIAFVCVYTYSKFIEVDRACEFIGHYLWTTLPCVLPQALAPFCLSAVSRAMFTHTKSGTWVPVSLSPYTSTSTTLKHRKTRNKIHIGNKTDIPRNFPCPLLYSILHGGGKRWKTCNNEPGIIDF